MCRYCCRLLDIQRIAEADLARLRYLQIKKIGNTAVQITH